MIALRIPKAFAGEIQIASGSAVELTVEAGKLVITPVDQEAYSLEELLAQVKPENVHGEVDWGESVGNEVW
ncbi:MAG: AbrB/MazE/SpoVT family DNA-binding domain-containing protein [Anaerolineae bacterium]|nr:AbrB/MazE/SpoVT family DNA-binding domain-containing protein [Anaerolineales bacterium]MCB8936019.1 AbrB/MazE/SpoVT family DNA-binding domain-containing protein [Promineifilum sp.]MCW5846420.1 AbrB/MazE/SpoVT family DNA-binding domain-containing protein [Anaerolineae bacterium]